MPGIDPPRLARLQEIPVCEKCCGLEHLFLFHSGMKPRLSGRREARGEKKNDLFFFFGGCCSGGAASLRYRCPHCVAGEFLSRQPLVCSLCPSSRVVQGLGLSPCRNGQRPPSVSSSLRALDRAESRGDLQDSDLLCNSHGGAWLQSCVTSPALWHFYPCWVFIHSTGQVSQLVWGASCTVSGGWRGSLTSAMWSREALTQSSYRGEFGVITKKPNTLKMLLFTFKMSVLASPTAPLSCIMKIPFREV